MKQLSMRNHTRSEIIKALAPNYFCWQYPHLHLPDPLLLLARPLFLSAEAPHNLSRRNPMGKKAIGMAPGSDPRSRGHPTWHAGEN